MTKQVKRFTSPNLYSAVLRFEIPCSYRNIKLIPLLCHILFPAASCSKGYVSIFYSIGVKYDDSHLN